MTELRGEGCFISVLSSHSDITLTPEEMWEARYQPLCGWGRHYIRENVSGTESYPKFTKSWHINCFIVGFYGTLNGPVVYRVGLEVAFALPHFKHQLVWLMPRGEAGGSPEPWLPGSWQTDKERSLSPPDSAVPGPLRKQHFTVLCTDQWRLPITSSLSWPSSYLTKNNGTAVP